MEFVAEYWFLTIIVFLFLGILWRSSVKNSKGENRFISILIALFILIPPWFLSFESSLISVIYAMLVGVILLLAYYKTNLCMLFRGFEGVAESLFYPPSKKWLLVIGCLLLVAPLFQYFANMV